jgi:N,N'-diacetyllegionaminate synthase
MTWELAGHRIGDGGALVVVAEIGLNHGGDPARALELVDAAASGGASAVKLQTLRGDRLVDPSAPAPAHVHVASLQAFFASFELDEGAHRALAQRARRHGLGFLSTPFDEDAVDMLVRVGVDALKIASGDITHHRLIAAAARTGLPLIMSTGMSELPDIDAAVACARGHGNARLALLHCVSAYPTPDDQQELGAISALAQRYGVPVGLSDHSSYPHAAAIATALGASIYERHLIRSADDDAIDAPVSSTPDDLRRVVAEAAGVRRALGTGMKHCGRAEAVNRHASRRGVFAVRDLRDGEALGEADVRMLRPETAVAASAWPTIIGRRVRRAVSAGSPLSLDDLE